MPGRIERIELWHVSGYEPPGFVPAVREGILAPVNVRPDGTVAVPQEPGLGAHVDERLLRRFGRRFHVSTPLRVAVGTIRHRRLGAARTLQRAKAAGASLAC
ncbi:MAG: hypothetical protein HRF46_13295 [Acidobacteriota bacterium]|jgi:hypothetical protein